MDCQFPNEHELLLYSSRPVDSRLGGCSEVRFLISSSVYFVNILILWGEKPLIIVIVFNSIRKKVK